MEGRHQTFAQDRPRYPGGRFDEGSRFGRSMVCTSHFASAMPPRRPTLSPLISPDGISTDLNFPRSWCQALAARAKGDAPAAQAAFTAARAEVERTVREQPEYGPSLCVLGLIDAGLGRKEEAIREGRHAVELLPLTKDSIDGAELMKFLAVIYAWTDEKDLAIDQIAATLRIPSTLSYGNLKLHPYWDALRGNPRFEKIVADLAPKNAEE